MMVWVSSGDRRCSDKGSTLPPILADTGQPDTMKTSETFLFIASLSNSLAVKINTPFAAIRKYRAKAVVPLPR